MSFISEKRGLAAAQSWHEQVGERLDEVLRT